MIAIKVDIHNNIKIVNISPNHLYDYEGYAPIDPDFNISIFVKNFDFNETRQPLNNIATDIYKSLIFGSVYITLEPDYDEDNDACQNDDEDKRKELTYKYYEVLKNKYV